MCLLSAVTCDVTALGPSSFHFPAFARLLVDPPAFAGLLFDAPTSLPRGKSVQRGLLGRERAGRVPPGGQWQSQRLWATWTEKLRVKCRLPNAARIKQRMIDRGQTVQEVISFIARMDRADVNELLLDEVAIPPEESFDAFYESKDQLFVFSKASAPAMTSPVSPPLPPTSASPIPPDFSWPIPSSIPSPFDLWALD
jgi:hypothetical protein